MIIILFAVVTGQQIGILSGPYYTILKALNTIQLSEQLKIKFPNTILYRYSGSKQMIMIFLK
ncbi:MAG: bacillithiol biosynthesis BshC [Ignavibacteria bacterium]